MKDKFKCIKTRAKHMGSSMMAVLVLFFLTSQGFLIHAESLPTYEKAYSIENILSDYQYFVNGNFTGTSGAHCVGTIAVRETLDTSNTVGDSQIAASYAGKIENISDFSRGSWLDQSAQLSQYKEYKSDKFYYGTAGSNVPDWLKSRFIQNSGYLDFDTAFNDLKQESKTWSDKGTDAYSLDGNTLTITLDSSKDTFVTIPYSTLSAASSIEIAGLNSVQDFAEHEYVISCTG